MKNRFESYLKGRIQSGGPVSLLEYMQACLADPEHGYYRVRDPIGATGDFITAPEVCQIFGELVGIWTLSCWNAMGRPAPLNLIELGPGRGTMMNDVLRASRVIPEFLPAVRVHLAETSPILRKQQKDTLKKHKVPLFWHDDPDLIPPGPSIILANEFLDALPVQQFVFQNGQWFERMIGLDSDDNLIFLHALKPCETADSLPQSLQTAQNGDILEVRPAMGEVMRMLSERAAHHPVFSLFIDYGHEVTAYGDTFQAVKSHRFVSPLETPGEADLTAHVDFGALKSEALQRQLKCYGPITQSHFLQRLGLRERALQLMRSASPEQQKAIAQGADRLASPEKMGVLFKVLVVTGGTDIMPPPFDTMSDLG